MKVSQLSLALLPSLFSVTSVLAQAGPPPQITFISVPDPTFTAGGTFNPAVNFSTSDGYLMNHFLTFELLASSDSAVVDIMCINAASFVPSCLYTFSASLPAGNYAIRVNITNSTVSSTSSSFHVAAFAQDCLTPPPAAHVSSVSSPFYTSLRIRLPPAGYVTPLEPNGAGSLTVSWDLRDERNTVTGDGISNMTFQFVNNRTGSAAGSYTWTKNDWSSFSFSLKNAGVSIGAWRLSATYSNAVEGSPLGSPVTAWSEVFYFIGNSGKKCDGLTVTGGTAGGGHNGAHRAQSGSTPFYILLAICACAILRLI